MLRVILIEDQPDFLNFYADALREYGFDDVLKFSDTKNIVEHIVDSYSVPSVLVTDYYVLPNSPNRFLPELIQRGVHLPVIVMSAKIQPEQLNSLSLKCRLCGFFPKGQPQAMIGQLAQHLMDVAPEAISAWHAYDLARQSHAYVRDWSEKKLIVARRVLSFEEVKVIADEVGMSATSTYDIRNAVMSFVLKNEPAERARALLHASDQRLKTLA